MSQNSKNWRNWLRRAERHLGDTLTAELTSLAFDAYRHGIAPLDFLASICR